MMDNTIKHTIDWRFSTLTSWVGVTIACAYYSKGQFELLLQLPVSLSLLGLLWFVIKRPNDHVVWVASSYWLLTLMLMQLSSTSLVFLHLVMFTATFSPHFSLPKVLSAVIGAMGVYFLIHQTRWDGNVPWVTFIIWFFFCAMNWFISRRIVESLNMHYQSRQNYKELIATQEMMAAMSAEQERIAISRELHDSLGHKLTALSIHLDFAKRTANTPLKETLQTCHTLSQEILEEVRETVSQQRADKGLLKQSLDSICAVTPSLKITQELASNIDSIAQSHALCVIRFCQEMISNTLKHTPAKALTLKVWIEKDTRNHHVMAMAYHDHPESSLPRQGNGLKGLHERMTELSGHFSQHIEGHKLISKICLPIDNKEYASFSPNSSVQALSS